MRLVKCELVDASLQYKEFSRRLGNGVIVDLDEVVGKRTVEDEHGNSREEDVILEDLLKGDGEGHPGLLHAFVAVEHPAAAVAEPSVEEPAAAVESHVDAEPVAEPHVE